MVDASAPGNEACTAWAFPPRASITKAVATVKKLNWPHQKRGLRSIGQGTYFSRAFFSGQGRTQRFAIPCAETMRFPGGKGVRSTMQQLCHVKREMCPALPCSAACRRADVCRQKTRRFWTPCRRWKSPRMNGFLRGSWRKVLSKASWPITPVS